MKAQYKILILLMALLMFSASCKRNPYKVSLSGIAADVEITRLEKELFSIQPEEIIDRLPLLKEKHDTILQLFSYAVNTGSIDDPLYGEYLTAFCTDRQNNDVYGIAMEVFPDIGPVEKEIETAFRHYRYYFPDRKVPKVFTCITGFNASIITMSGVPVLGISLDKYLGPDCSYYPGLGIYNYMTVRMTPDHVVPDCLYGWAASVWDYSDMKYPADNVLAQMIHEGKLRYFTRCMLPDLPEELIFGFTPEQMKFCRNNEDLMWQYLIENELIFKTDQFTIRKLTGEAPFTSYFSNESPGRAAVWLGFRIIESYMSGNRKDGALGSLMDDVNIQEILEKAKYDPK